MKNKNMEAVNWLTNNKNTSAFASNFFGETTYALNFVKELYKMGATNVEIGHLYDEDWRIKSEGGPYADELLITLPKNKGKRLDILGVIMNHHPDECHNFPKTSVKVNWNTATTVSLWWD